MREQPRIPEERLRACLQDQYDLYPVTLEFLPRGQDSNAGVYRVVSEQGTTSLLPIKPRPVSPSDPTVQKGKNSRIDRDLAERATT